MNEAASVLLSPLRVGQKTYPNRLVAAPMGGIFVENGRADPEALTVIRGKTRGGIGALIVGETVVSADSARDDNYFDFSIPENFSGMCEYVEAIKESDPERLALLELVHCGESGGPGAEKYRVNEMTRETMAEIAAQFAQTAFHAKRAGFDGVMVHMGHRWLFGQFLSPAVNQRADGYGGSVANRAKIALMTLKAIRERCGEDFLIECRISGRENEEVSYSDEEICEYARLLAEYADLIHVSAGVYRDPMRSKMMSTSFDAHGCNVEIAAKIRAAVDIPVAVVGGINDPKQAAEIITSGKADLIALGRQMLADPLFPEKLETGEGDQIRGCLRCMRCFPGPFEEAMAELGGVFPTGCSVNPLYEFPEYTELPQAEEPKRVLVLGGGVAGMQCAVTLSDRGHLVTLLEKADVLGGILNFAKDDPNKADLKKLADSLAAEVRARDIDLRLHTELSPELLAELKPEHVVCAVGSSPLRPPIPGLDGANVIAGMDAYAPGAVPGDEIVVLGGGLVGCETALHLSGEGKRVTIVEMRDELAPDAYRLHKHKLRDLIAADGRITVCLNAVCKAVREDGAEVETDGETRFLPADAVVSALGMRANPTQALEALCEGLPFTKIGDCLRARKIYDAIREGFLTAVEL